MNIVYLISRAKKGAGPINQAYYIISGLNKIPGVNAVLISIAPEMKNYSWLNRFKEGGIPVVQMNHSSWQIIKSVRFLKKYIKEHDVDIVHSAGYKADFVNLLLRKDVKTISTQRSLPNEIVEGFPRIVRPPIEKLHLFIISKLSRIVACSQSLQQSFIQDYKMKIDVVRNGVDTDKYVPVSREEKNNIRSRLCLPLDKSIYLVLGTFRPRKNVGVIIDAFLNIEDPNSLLLIVGGGAQENELKQKASSCNRIVFTGMTTDAKPYLQASDILISSSLAEGLPNTVLEAISCGLPCILSDIGPHLEILEGTDAAVFFERNSSKELSEKIKESRNWNLEEKSKIARELAESHYSISRLASNYHYIYKQALQQ